MQFFHNVHQSGAVISITFKYYTRFLTQMKCGLRQTISRDKHRSQNKLKNEVSLGLYSMNNREVQPMWITATKKFISKWQFEAR